jgi:hypothetical protein
MILNIGENPEDPYRGVELLKSPYRDEDERWVL